MGSLLKKFIILNTVFSFTFCSMALAQTLTLEEWNKFDHEEKEGFSEGYFDNQYSNLEVITLTLNQNQDLNQITDPIALLFAKQMQISMQQEVQLEVEDDYYALIGSPYIFSVTVLILNKTTALAGSLSYIQKGCVMPNDEFVHFENETEALKAGCDINADVSWQAHGSFDTDLTPIYLSTYMEWSGH